MAFAAGAALVVMDDETTRLGPDLIPWLHAEGVTIFSPPPTLPAIRPAVAISQRRPCRPSSQFTSAASRLAAATSPIGGHRGFAACWNDYGPTECSVVALRCGHRGQVIRSPSAGRSQVSEGVGR